MRLRVLLATAALSICLAASPAFAYNETGTTYLPKNAGGSWCWCHSPNTTQSGFGPHRGYTSGTNACATCHTLHDAPGALKLLPADTVKATCLVCHDGTGGRGVYGTIAARGLTAGADHSIETTSVVPGGSASTGGSATMTFRGTGGKLTCSDCHTPHGTDMVTAFLGERQREPEFDQLPVVTSSRLLKRKPGGAATPVDEYGSDWCRACHAGRVSGLPGVMNHPVESKLTHATPYNYRGAGIVGPAPYPTGTTVVGAMGIDTDVPGYNRGYLWPYPRTGAQAGHYPICQQCHEDTRSVGNLSADGTQATPSVAALTGYPAGDGRTATDNPRFQNFPHETTGYRMLVEASTTSGSDDLCLNCHPSAALP